MCYWGSHCLTLRFIPQLGEQCPNSHDCIPKGKRNETLAMNLDYDIKSNTEHRKLPFNIKNTSLISLIQKTKT